MENYSKPINYHQPKYLQCSQPDKLGTNVQVMQNPQLSNKSLRNYCNAISAYGKAQIAFEGRRPLNLPVEDIIELLKAGFTQKEIAEDLGCSQGTISNLLKQVKKDGLDNVLAHRKIVSKTAFKKPYEKFSLDELKEKILELSEYEQFDKFNSFIFDLQEITPEQKKLIIDYIKIVENNNAPGRIKDKNREKECIEAIQTWMNRVNENVKPQKSSIALSVSVKPRIKLSGNEELKATYKAIASKAKTENSNLYQTAIKLFSNEEEIGQYIYHCQEYIKYLKTDIPKSNTLKPFIEVLKGQSVPSEEAGYYLSKIENYFLSSGINNYSLSKFIELFPKDCSFKKKITDKFINNVYIQTPTTIHGKYPNGQGEYTATLSSKAKKALMEKKTGEYIERFLDFENAMSSFAAREGEIGIKRVTEKNLFELKLKGGSKSDRMFAFIPGGSNEYIFDQYFDHHPTLKEMQNLKKCARKQANANARNH